jgi:hypothetical protein
MRRNEDNLEELKNQPITKFIQFHQTSWKHVQAERKIKEHENTL